MDKVIESEKKTGLENDYKSSCENIYGKYYEALKYTAEDLEKRLLETGGERADRDTWNDEVECGESGDKIMKLFEHLSIRIKSPDSMLEKLERRGLSANTYNALREIHDAIGVRVVCLFVDDVYKVAEMIRGFKGCKVVREKDYIDKAKPNGYRSYHMIIEIMEPFLDVDGNNPGKFFAEIQIRTIAMDSWAALEHELKYKKDIKNEHLIVSELKRCAEELAACDVSMQTIRNMILR
ncbi:MAG: GTP pyrophosphokinase family protein [Lachnospiraceae bacterium]|nr:GTP pyrophosphokinase family protein [Lachnospiraceae bacterium]